MNRKDIRVFLLRTAVCLAVIVVCYLGVRAIWGLFNKDEHKDQKTSVKVVLRENYALVSELQNLDPTPMAISIDMYTSRASLAQNIESLNKYADDNQIKDENPELLAQIKSIKAQEEAVFSNFDQAYNLYVRTLDYLPLADLGNLDPTSNSAEVSNRIISATNALATTSDGRAPIKGVSIGQQKNYVSEDTKTAISSSIACLNKIKAEVESKNTNSYKQSVKKCHDDYQVTRESAAKDILSSLQTEQVKKLLDDLAQAVNSADRLKS